MIIRHHHLHNSQFSQRFKPYAESNYEALPYIEALEAVGSRGDRVLVKGIRTGSAKVGVRPADPAFKKVWSLLYAVILAKGAGKCFLLTKKKKIIISVLKAELS